MTNDGTKGSDVAERLYREHGRILLAYATSLVVEVRLAEDVVHQVFLKLLKCTVTVPEPARPYLLRAVRNTALNQSRDRQREVSLDVEAHWLEEVAGGGAAWNEAALGPLVSANDAALRTLLRGAAIKECDWDWTGTSARQHEWPISPKREPWGV